MQSIVAILINSAMGIVLLLIAVIDVKTRMINQKLLIALLLGSVIAVFISGEISLISALAAMALMFLTLSFIYIASRKGIGWGDVKLCVCIAPYLGIEKAFSMLFLAILLCGVAAILLLAVCKSNRNREVPFAPFAALSTLIMLLV